jgi:hypothetical protein
MKVLSVLALVLLSSCAVSPVGPAYQTSPAPPTDHATLIVYGSTGGVSRIHFTVDTKEVASLHGQGYTVIALKRGKHVVRAGLAPTPVQLEAVPGETYFLKYGTVTTGLPGLTPLVYHGLFGQVPNSIAFGEIVDYRLQPADVPVVGTNP